MYTVGLDVDRDNLVFTVKILLYAGNSCINSPLVLITFGTICLLKNRNILSRQSAGNFSLVTNTKVVTKNIYTKYSELPLISEHVPTRKNNLKDSDFGYFLAGLIEGDG
jgi:hypothetical protein